MAGAAYAVMSPGGEIGAGVLNEAAPLVEYAKNALSWSGPSRPSTQASTISLVASTPVGAPLAMSTLGIAARSVRAPDTPSMMHRPVTGSLWKQGSVIATTSCGGRQVWPPSSDLITVWKPARLVPPKCVKNA